MESIAIIQVRNNGGLHKYDSVAMMGRGHILSIFRRTERIADELDMESETTPQLLA